MNRYPDDAAKWAACRAREVQADGAFVVMVQTTGIFCRPICPERPLRRNVRFADTAQDALAAGFRACLRCRPTGLRRAAKTA